MSNLVGNTYIKCIWFCLLLFSVAYAVLFCQEFNLILDYFNFIFINFCHNFDKKKKLSRIGVTCGERLSKQMVSAIDHVLIFGSFARLCLEVPNEALIILYDKMLKMYEIFCQMLTKILKLFDNSSCVISVDSAIRMSMLLYINSLSRSHHQI